VVVALAAVVWLLAGASAPVRATRQRSALPSSLSDAEFWALSRRLSEANGVFVSRSGSPDNLLSNENAISYVAAELPSRVKPGGVYLGVGPEQNFTYIAAMQPRMAFITDIRRGNLQLHLLYKALFGLSSTRSELVARLFSRRAVPASTSKTTAAELMRAVGDAPAMTDAEYRANVATIETYLTRTHTLPLDKDDLDGIAYVADNFRRFGPDINYTSSINGRFRAFGSYGMIQSLTDGSGVGRTYLASDEAFAYVKSLEAKNLVVPVVGNRQLSQGTRRGRRRVLRFQRRAVPRAGWHLDDLLRERRVVADRCRQHLHQAGQPRLVRVDGRGDPRLPMSVRR
jgi:hypothetical protein